MIAPDVLTQVLTETQLPGRWEHHYRTCDIYLDVGHNPAAAEFIRTRLQRKPIQGDTYLVIGVMADKDLAGIIEPLRDEIKRVLTVDLPTDRAAKAVDIAATIEALTHEKCYPYASVRDALAELDDIAQKGDRIIVMGSFFTVAAAHQALQLDLNQ